MRKSGAAAHGGLDDGGGEKGARSGGRTRDDVEVAKVGFDLFVGQRAGAESGGEAHGALKITTRHGDLASASALECLGGFFPDFAGADGENTGIGQIAEDGQGQFDGHVGHAELALVDGGVGAHVFGRLGMLLGKRG